MSTQIKFKTTTNFLGRNGYGKCTGLDAWVFNDVVINRAMVEIAPLTSRNEVGRCYLQIPASALPKVIAMLQGIADELATAEVCDARDDASSKKVDPTPQPQQ